MTGDQEGNSLLEMLEDTFMTQIISQPTRENNILDLVFVTDPDLVREGRVGDILSDCDHHLIRFSIRTEYELIENVSRIPDYEKANFSLFFFFFFFYVFARLHRRSYQPLWCWSEAGPLVMRASVL